MDEEESLFPDDIDDDLDDVLEDDDEEEVIGYKPAPYFDTQSGDFLLNGSGQIITADEVSAYIQWCENVISTDRYNHSAYSDDIGIDYDDIFNAEDKDEAESIIESEISEALDCDPYGRTLYVQNVDVEWIGPDEANVHIDIVALDNELVSVDTVIKK